MGTIAKLTFIGSTENQKNIFVQIDLVPSNKNRETIHIDTYMSANEIWDAFNIHPDDQNSFVSPYNN